MDLPLEVWVGARIRTWRKEVAELHRRGVDDQADAVEACAAELEADLAAWRREGLGARLDIEA